MSHLLVLPLSRLICPSISLPKRHESFMFFQIKGDQVKKFRQQLSNLIPLITTAAKGKKILQKVVEHKKRHNSIGSQVPIGDDLLTVTAINIAFSKAGLDKVWHTLYCWIDPILTA